MQELEEKNCLKLPPHLKKFLVWLVDNKNDAYNYTKYKVPYYFFFFLINSIYRSFYKIFNRKKFCFV